MSGSELLAAPVEAGASFAAGNPAVILNDFHTTTLGGRTYDVSPDGERFVVLKQVRDANARPEIIVVQNWFEELNRLAPPAE